MEKLRGGGLFEIEMGLKLKQEDHPFRNQILAIDQILATYREAVAVDQAKRAPSGAPYYASYQFAERQTAHASKAANAIKALQPKGLEERISTIKARLAVRGIPTYNDRRLAVIERQLEPILHDQLQLRDALRSAITRGDAETVHVIMTWPGYTAEQLVGDHRQPATAPQLLPMAQQFLNAHTSPKDTAELAALEADQMAMENIYRTALVDLEHECPAIIPDPIKEMAGIREPSPPDAA